MNFWKSEEYVNESGFLVKESEEYTWNELTNSKSQTGVRSYSGAFGISVMTERGPQNFPITFDFPENFTLKDCFDKFEEFAKQKVEELKEEKRKKDLIISPSMVNNGKGLLQFPTK